MTLALAAVIDQAQALALRILEVERHAAVALDDIAVRDAQIHEAGLPPGQRVLSRDPQTGAADAVNTAPFTRDWKVEEGQVRPGRCHAVAIEQVIGAWVVLVDRLLDQAHAERLRIERDILRCPCGQRRQMMQAFQLHVMAPSPRKNLFQEYASPWKAQQPDHRRRPNASHGGCNSISSGPRRRTARHNTAAASVTAVNAAQIHNASPTSSDCSARGHIPSARTCTT